MMFGDGTKFCDLFNAVEDEKELKKEAQKEAFSLFMYPNV
jgi:hypothetical protein